MTYMLFNRGSRIGEKFVRGLRECLGRPILGTIPYYEHQLATEWRSIAETDYGYICLVCDECMTGDSVFIAKG